ncbi:hypothetical protein [Kitasatospora cathayae]|uniref:CMP/dCMP-type deaminase domain-containing protein n=1 Tax=Kitasatospora cathayae TaxID=3004092 RepID=A0ABY7Q479_9ACTN|nr:hypothetical protein [Kitasatospora sp. HUAS 3-15]WBP87432.1 hypothetical protein O1G21_17340 [Kitasatospora sp. HUAS 3-15]
MGNAAVGRALQRAKGKKTLEAQMDKAAAQKPSTKFATATPLRPKNGKSGKKKDSDVFSATSGYDTFSRDQRGTLEAKELSDQAQETPVGEGWRPPWADIEQLEGWPPHNCAEAHLYAEMVSKGVKPKYYLLKTVDVNGKVAPPCKNCAQWVGKAFGAVVGGNRDYKPGG